MMKRRMALLLCAVMVVSMAACGKEKTEEKAADTKETAETTETTASEELGEANIKDFQYKALDYVTLGDYSGLDVTVSGEYEYSEQGLVDYVNNKMIGTGADSYYKDESQTEVAENSIVNVDYTGYLDGEAFDGGAAQNVLLDIAGNSTPGGGSYIDGFSSGLAGAKVGDVVDCDVTFPEDYQAPNLAGKQVVFRFQINYICGHASYETLTDAYVSENFGQDTVEEFLESAKTAYQENLDETYNQDCRMAVIEQVKTNAKINSYPEAVVSARSDDYIRLMMKQFGVSTVAELDAAWAKDTSMDGATVADYRSYVEEQVKSNLDTEMIFLAIAETEGMELESEDFDDYLKEYLGNNEGVTEESLYLNYGSTAEIGELYLKNIALANKAVEFCKDSANITVSTSEAE